MHAWGLNLDFEYLYWWYHSALLNMMLIHRALKYQFYAEVFFGFRWICFSFVVIKERMNDFWLIFKSVKTLGICLITNST